MNIAKKILRKLKISKRLKEVVVGLIRGILLIEGKVTLKKISDASGLDSSQFSRLLSEHPELAKDQLNRYARRMLKKGLKKSKKKIVAGTNYKAAVIVDATLHSRSTRHTENAQKFNHGKGWIVGHQWTNIVVYVGGILVPLPPIPFHTKKYCRANNILYQSEHAKIMAYLQNYLLLELLPEVKAKEIVFLMDSGYDNKKLQKFILNQGYEYIVSIKKTRSVRSETQGWRQVWDLFNRSRKNSPWKTVRVKTSNGKQRRYRIRELSANLKGIKSLAKLICSEKPNGGKLYLASSNETISARNIVIAYRLRWMVEVFHHDVKSLLGLEHLGAHNFKSIEAYVNWIYFSYLFIEEEKLHSFDKHKTTQKTKEQLIAKFKIEDLNKLRFLATRNDKGRSIVRELDARIAA